jgi:hypothetical protein
MSDRLNAIKCDKCIKIDWEKLWCSAKDGVCSAIDFRLGISYFYDSHHVNGYGSMLVGECTRKHYNEWLQRRTAIAA